MPPRVSRTRDIIAPRLGVGGRNTDKPTWTLRPDELADGSQDAIIYEGALRRRKGAKLHASYTGGYSQRFDGIYRAKFILAGRTTTYVTQSSNTTFPYSQDYIYDNGVRGSSTGPFGQAASNGAVLPRCMYQDQLLFCWENGVYPLYRTSGANRASTNSISGAATTTANQSIVTFATSATADRGCYQYISVANVTFGVWTRVLENATPTTLTLEGIRASAGVAVTGFFPNTVAFAYSAVALPSSGTISIAAGTGTGVGTKWDEYRPDNGSPPNGILLTNAATKRHFLLGGITSDTTLTSGMGAGTTDEPYVFTKQLPWRDACVHNEVLYGVGNKYYPSRVYIAPAGWNMSFPPGAVLPFDPVVEYTSPNLSDFLLDFIDVPSYQDNDDIVAILATDGPRLVLKKNSVYGLYGDPPSITSRLIHSGDGCIDLRSAISVPEGSFWAGNDGIYRYRYGQFTDLTTNWMRNEWRALTSSGIEYCTMGVTGNKLIVSIRTADASHQTRTYVYDLELQRWLPEITNIHPRYMFTANIAGEVQQLLVVDDSYTSKIINLAPALDNSGPARDEVGTGPNFKVITGDSWSQKDGIEGEVRALQLTLHNNFRDTNSIGTSTLDVKMVMGGSFYGEREGQGFKYNTTLYDTSYYGPDGAKAVGTIASTPGDQVRRSDFEVNRTGRRLHVEVKETTTSSTLDTIELGETLLTVRDLREGT